MTKCGSLADNYPDPTRSWLGSAYAIEYVNRGGGNAENGHLSLLVYAIAVIIRPS